MRFPISLPLFYMPILYRFRDIRMLVKNNNFYIPPVFDVSVQGDPFGILPQHVHVGIESWGYQAVEKAVSAQHQRVTFRCLNYKDALCI